MRMMIAALGLALSLSPALATDGVRVEGAYARVTMASAITGAVFMTIVNGAAEDDRLISAESDVAATVGLHSNVMSAEGMMQMLEAEAGFPVAASATRPLARGGDHIMLIGLTRPLAEGDRFTLTLTFEKAGKVVVVVPVGDPAGAAGDAGMTDHSTHGTVTE